MVRGPKPKPIALHIVAGTLRKHRHGSGELPAPAAKLPERPSSLRGTAGKFWDTHIVPLGGLGVLTEHDLPLLESLCETFALYQAALKEARRHPLRQDARMAWKTYAEQFNRMLAECGLTPVARARLKIGGCEQTKGVSARQRGAM